MREQYIVPDGYSSLIPLTSRPGGPVDEPVNEISRRFNAKSEKILLAWSKEKGYAVILLRSATVGIGADVDSAIVVITFSKKDRLEDTSK